MRSTVVRPEPSTLMIAAHELGCLAGPGGRLNDEGTRLAMFECVVGRVHRSFDGPLRARRILELQPDPGLDLAGRPRAERFAEER